MMVKQTKDYLEKQKKKYLKFSILWASISLCIFVIGCMMTGERANNYTLVAALFVLPFGLNFTRYLMYRKYKSPDVETAQLLETIQGTYELYHGAIVPGEVETYYFPHIALTGSKVYFLSPDKRMIERGKNPLSMKLQAKGFSVDDILFEHIHDLDAVQSVVTMIQEDACLNKHIGSNTAVIGTMMM